MSMRVAVFTRPPIAGRCKTRLARTIGDELAAELHAAFVIDTLATIRAEPTLEPELHVTEAPDHPFFAATCARFALPAPRLQCDGSLGARMAHALEGSGAPGCVVGTDAPTLPRSIYLSARSALDRHDVVCTPASDGGYTLIGTSRVSARFLHDLAIRWSTRHTLADTMRAAPSPIALTAPWYDVDDADGLALLRTHLTLDPSAAPETAALLRRRTSTF